MSEYLVHRERERERGNERDTERELSEEWNPSILSRDLSLGKERRNQLNLLSRLRVGEDANHDDGWDPAKQNEPEGERITTTMCIWLMLEAIIVPCGFFTMIWWV